MRAYGAEALDELEVDGEVLKAAGEPERKRRAMLPPTASFGGGACTFEETTVCTQLVLPGVE
jgi:hypothetical protein